MSDPNVIPGTGNVFADLGLADAREMYAKSLLSIMVARTIRDRGLTQAEAARILGTTQPKVSDLIRGQLNGFSVERLLRFMNALGLNVRIQIAPPAPGSPPGKTIVEMLPE
jgi:predicted XRE-type DNA-binding protein